MCAIHVWINGSVYLFIMGSDEVDSFVYDGWGIRHVLHCCNLMIRV
jgi:hypothetical protein